MEIQETQLSNEQKIIKTLFKEFNTPYNSRSISKQIGITHAGAFKILKKLEKEEVVKAQTIGKSIIYAINFDNPIANKKIELALVLEAQNYKHWLYEFKKLEDLTEFVMLFGSILNDEKKARDIDLLILSKKENHDKIRKFIKERNEVNSKKIHLLLQTTEDFKKDVRGKNKPIIEIIKTGVVLYGQENIRRELKI